MYVVLKAIYEFLKDKNTSPKKLCIVEVHYKNKSIFIEAFVDTGNTLTYNGNKVSIIDISLLNPFFDKDTIALLSSTGSILEKLEHLTGFYSVMFTSLNNHMDSLLAFTTDYIVIEGKKYENEILGITKNLDSYKLILNNDFGRIFYENET